MTREEAEAACAKLAAESPDRETHRFLPREDENGDWSVVKVNLPPVSDTLTAETKADSRPPNGEDPRPNTFRNVPPFGGA